MSYGDLHGALDVWVPLNAEYDKHREQIETLRSNGAEIWHYVCCAPREYGYINRFMDYPLLSTRYLHWGNYKYDLTGFLHWAANRYQPGQDPFIQNCPEHHNTDAVCYLPAGDTHILYPGNDGPWLSIRLEAQRESAEEYELLKKLGADVRELEDGLLINGKGQLVGGSILRCHDHRIAMAAAAAALISRNAVTIPDSDCVNKSSPGFFEDFSRLEAES